MEREREREREKPPPPRVSCIFMCNAGHKRTKQATISQSNIPPPLKQCLPASVFLFSSPFLSRFLFLSSRVPRRTRKELTPAINHSHCYHRHSSHTALHLALPTVVRLLLYSSSISTEWLLNRGSYERSRNSETRRRSSDCTIVDPSIRV